MKWLQFILSHSIFVAICAAALCWQTVLLLHLGDDLNLYAFVFLATLSSYNLYWLISRYFFRPAGTSIKQIVSGNPVQLILFLAAAGGAVYFYFKAGLLLVEVLPAVFLTLVYSGQLIPLQEFRRKAGILKTLLLAITWTYVTAFLPIMHLGLQVDEAGIFIITRRFLFMLMLCIIFDSRDIVVDKIRGMRSLATELSTKTLRLLIVIIFIILFLSNFLSARIGISLPHMIALQVSTLALLITYYYSTKKQGYFFYYFFVDGMMLFSALVTFIAGKWLIL